MTLPKNLKSRKLWLAIIAATIAFGNAMWDWGFTLEQVWTILTPFLMFIGVEGAADIKERGVM